METVVLGRTDWDWWYAMCKKDPKGLVDLSSTRVPPEPLFVDFSELPALPVAKAPAPRTPSAPAAYPERQAVPEGMREHHKWTRANRTWIECPYCGEETSTSHETLAHYGKSCPRCGSKHRFDGRTTEATPAQRAYAQKYFGKPKPRIGSVPLRGPARPYAPSRRDPVDTRRTR